MTAPARIAIVLVAALPLAGCSTVRRPDTEAPRRYVWIMETGSNIPRKVPVDAPGNARANIEKVSGDGLRTLQNDQTLRRMTRPGG